MHQIPFERPEILKHEVTLALDKMNNGANLFNSWTQSSGQENCVKAENRL